MATARSETTRDGLKWLRFVLQAGLGEGGDGVVGLPGSGTAPRDSGFLLCPAWYPALTQRGRVPQSCDFQTASSSTWA